MNNPLIPQGSLLEQKNKGRARVRLAVFLVLSIHGIGLLALLMQGCKKEPEAAVPPPDQTAAATSNAPPAFDATNVAPATNEPPATNVAVPATSDQPPAVTPGAPTEYKIAKGDNLSTIAKKFHVTLAALTAANPGIEPTKLQIGQTIKVPAPAASASSGATGATAAPEAASGEEIYTVVSGDTLTGIAQKTHVTVRALRSANSLKTDSIKVGQKLKIPKPTVPAVPSTNPAPGTGTSGTSGR